MSVPMLQLAICIRPRDTDWQYGIYGGPESNAQRHTGRDVIPSYMTHRGTMPWYRRQHKLTAVPDLTD